jgi:hypothetical protein
LPRAASRVRDLQRQFVCLFAFCYLGGDLTEDLRSD